MNIHKKYPDRYFEHWLMMYFTRQSEIDEVRIKEHNLTYIQIEGADEFAELKKEVGAIQKNRDEDLFLKFAKKNTDSDVSQNNLHLMINMILNH